MSTFLFSTTAVMLAYSQGLITLPFLLFLMSFISMQLLEFFLWINLNRPAYNKLFSVAGILLIASQPLFLLLTLSNTYAHKKTLIYSYLTLSILFLALYPLEMKTVVGKNLHLEWKWLRVPGLALLVWFFFFLAAPIISGSYALSALLIGTAAYSYYNYINYGTWGSMWCWIANVSAFVYIGKVLYKLTTGRKPIEF
jgi:hypothetical protein